MNRKIFDLIKQYAQRGEEFKLDSHPETFFFGEIKDESILLFLDVDGYFCEFQVDNFGYDENGKERIKPKHFKTWEEWLSAKSSIKL